MDDITAEKLFAMKYYYRKSQIFLYNFSLHSLIIFFFSFLISLQSHRFPPDAFSSMIQIVVTPPSFFSPRCLFVVVNVIIVYIVGERKLTDAKSSSVYEKYCAERMEEMSMSCDEDIRQLVEKVVDEKEEEEVDTVDHDDGANESEREQQKEEEEEDIGLANEELNKRAEAFIARVNMLRRVEAVDYFQ